MIAYDEFNTFRTPSKRTPQRSSPERIAALDDLHRTLYGSLHPAVELSDHIVQSDRELVEGGDGSGESWLEQNAWTAAIAVLGAFAVYAWTQRQKPTPLRGPADLPLTTTVTSTP